LEDSKTASLPGEQDVEVEGAEETKVLVHAHHHGGVHLAALKAHMGEPQLDVGHQTSNRESPPGWASICTCKMKDICTRL